MAGRGAADHVRRAVGRRPAVLHPGAGVLFGPGRVRDCDLLRGRGRGARPADLQQPGAGRMRDRPGRPRACRYRDPPLPVDGAAGGAAVGRPSAGEGAAGYGGAEAERHARLHPRGLPARGPRPPPPRCAGQGVAVGACVPRRDAGGAGRWVRGVPVPGRPVGHGAARAVRRKPGHEGAVRHQDAEPGGAAEAGGRPEGGGPAAAGAGRKRDPRRQGPPGRHHLWRRRCQRQRADPAASDGRGLPRVRGDRGAEAGGGARGVPQHADDDDAAAEHHGDRGAGGEGGAATAARPAAVAHRDRVSRPADAPRLRAAVAGRCAAAGARGAGDGCAGQGRIRVSAGGGAAVGRGGQRHADDAEHSAAGPGQPGDPRQHRLRRGGAGHRGWLRPAAQAAARSSQGGGGA